MTKVVLVLLVCMACGAFAAQEQSTTAPSTSSPTMPAIPTTPFYNPYLYFTTIMGANNQTINSTQLFGPPPNYWLIWHLCYFPMYYGMPPHPACYAPPPPPPKTPTTQEPSVALPGTASDSVFKSSPISLLQTNPLISFAAPMGMGMGMATSFPFAPNSGLLL
jgi:hypothetical protein